MTFWRKLVNRTHPHIISFPLEGETVLVQAAGEPCRRCKRPVDVKTACPVLTVTQKPPLPRHRRISSFRDASAVKRRYKVGLYHERCIPPNVFHAAAGSRPAPGRSRVVPPDARTSPPRAARAGVRGNAMRQGAAE